MTPLRVTYRETFVIVLYGQLRLVIPHKGVYLMKSSTMLLSFGLLTVSHALAQSDKFTVNPFRYDPYGSNLVSAAWVPGLGCPTGGGVAYYPLTTLTPYTDPTCLTGDARDKKVEGLLLVKTGPIGNNAAAGASLGGVKGEVLTELGFDVRKGTLCGGGGPRFNVTLKTGTFHFIGCAALPITSTGTYGERRGATATALSVAGIAYPPIPVGSVIESINIIQDEGQDTGTGLAVLDNININGTLVGRGPQQ